MPHPIFTAARTRPVLFAGLALATAVTLFFAVRLVVFTVYWSDPAHRDQQIATWMTPGYVARSWQLPPEVVGAALDLDPARATRGKTLQELADDRGVPPSVLIDSLEAVIADHRTSSR